MTCTLHLNYCSTWIHVCIFNLVKSFKNPAVPTIEMPVMTTEFPLVNAVKRRTFISFSVYYWTKLFALKVIQLSFDYPDPWGLVWIVQIINSLDNRKYYHWWASLLQHVCVSNSTILWSSVSWIGLILFCLSIIQKVEQIQCQKESLYSFSVWWKRSNYGLQMWLIYIHKKVGLEWLVWIIKVWLCYWKLQSYVSNRIRAKPLKCTCYHLWLFSGAFLKIS